MRGIKEERKEGGGEQGAVALHGPSSRTIAGEVAVQVPLRQASMLDGHARGRWAHAVERLDSPTKPVAPRRWLAAVEVETSALMAGCCQGLLERAEKCKVR